MSQPELIKLARPAMGTRFELVLYGEDPVHLRAAGEEALAEIERLDGQLSLYHADSELRGLNARAARGPVAVEPRFFRLLQQAAQIGKETNGAFDLTITPLLECWGFIGGTGDYPEPAAVEAARERVGWPLLELDEAHFTVRFLHPGVRLDLGAIGKGYALERAAALLRDNGVTWGLLHGGTSTSYGLGPSPEADGWSIAIDHPHPSSPSGPLATVSLRDHALSVSAVTGKFFVHDGQRWGHVLDPRTGFPVQHTLLAAVALPSPTAADAWSTALLVLGQDGLALLREQRPEVQALVVSQREAEGELDIGGVGCEG